LLQIAAELRQPKRPRSLILGYRSPGEATAKDLDCKGGAAAAAHERQAAELVKTGGLIASIILTGIGASPQSGSAEVAPKPTLAHPKDRMVQRHPVLGSGTARTPGRYAAGRVAFQMPESFRARVGFFGIRQLVPHTLPSRLASFTSVGWPADHHLCGCDNGVSGVIRRVVGSGLSQP
jgi:hypothetical protein